MSEVANFQEADQFQAGKSQFECGYFAVAMAKSMAQPGHTPTLTAQQVIDDAEAWYAQYDGSDDISNFDGMTLDQEYSLLQQVDLHYQAIAMDINVMHGWLRDGYPILAAVVETSVYDIALGDNPYPWTPAGTHVILLTGIAADNNFLVRDSANCTNLFDPNSLRPGPRHYDANRLQFVSATVVVPPWKPRPTSATPPQGGTMGIPQGWHDDGTKLVSPNGHYLMHGFRQHVLDASNWDQNDMPLEEEQAVPQIELHTNRGAGARQLTVEHMLVWTQAMGVKESACGAEIFTCYQRIAEQTKQISDLQAQLAIAHAAPSPVPQKIDQAAAIAALQIISSNMTTLDKAIATARTALGIQ